MLPEVYFPIIADRVKINETTGVLSSFGSVMNSILPNNFQRYSNSPV